MHKRFISFPHHVSLKNDKNVIFLFLCLIICFSLCILFLILSHNCALYLSFLQATVKYRKHLGFIFITDVYTAILTGALCEVKVLWTVHSSLWQNILCAEVVTFGLYVWYKVTYLTFSLHFNTLSWWLFFFLCTFNWHSADILHTSCCCWFLNILYREQDWVKYLR